MKSFRKYLKEDLNSSEHVAGTNNVGMALEAQVVADTNYDGKVEFGVVFGSYTIGSNKTFDKVVTDEKTAKDVWAKDKSAIKALMNTIAKEVEARIKSEMSKLGYK